MHDSKLRQPRQSAAMMHKMLSVATAIAYGPDSKHWFTTSFFQPLPYFVYAIGSRKLSANEQFFVDAQTVVSLLQTTQIKQGVSFIAANKVYTSTNKTAIV